MSINLITGKPGAGKTYLSINLLIEQYYNRVGAGLYEYKSDDIEVVSNIDGLRLPHISIDAYCREHGLTFNQFYSKDYQEEFTEKIGKKVIHVIDECQRWLGPRFKDELVIFYFDYHRHFDHEIWLISQDRTKICKQISILHEFEYRAVPKSLSIAGELKYNILQAGEHSEKKFLRPNKEIFGLYKSAVSHTQKVKKSKVFVYVGVAAVAALFAGYSFFKNVTSRGPNQTVYGEVQASPLREVAEIKPPANLDLDRYAWCQVAHVATEKTRRLYIHDHLTNQFIKSTDYPFPFKIRGNIVFAYLPTKVIQARQAPDGSRAGSQAGPLGRVGGAGTEVVTETARAYQKIF